MYVHILNLPSICSDLYSPLTAFLHGFQSTRGWGGRAAEWSDSWWLPSPRCLAQVGQESRVLLQDSTHISLYVSVPTGQESFNGYIQVDWIAFTLCPRPMFTSVVRFARNGAFHVEPPPPKPRIARQLRAPTKEAKRIIPTQVNGVPPFAFSCVIWRLIRIFIFPSFCFI